MNQYEEKGLATEFRKSASTSKIRDLLKDIKIDSVELQHRGTRILVKKGAE